MEQNKEIFALREKQAEEIERKYKSKNISQGMESRQLYFEEQPEQICVKGDIIHNEQELELVSRKINKSSKKLTLNLLYKATADSDKAEAFHKKCDKAQSTLVLIETDKGKRFGGFTKCSWAGECIEKKMRMLLCLVWIKWRLMILSQMKKLLDVILNLDLSS